MLTKRTMVFFITILVMLTQTVESGQNTHQKRNRRADLSWFHHKQNARQPFKDIGESEFSAEKTFPENDKLTAMQSIISRITVDSLYVLVEALGQFWRNNDWADTTKYIYNYDSSGRGIKIICQILQNNAWMNYARDTTTYDMNGHPVEDVIQIWQNNTWVNDDRYTYTYDANGRLTKYFEEDWVPNYWIYISRDTIAYDMNGRETEDVYQYLVSDPFGASGWVTISRHAFTYDANGRLTIDVYQFWINHAWSNWSRDTIAYNMNGRPADDVFQIWQYNAWVNNDRYTFTYDANGRVTEYVEQNWIDEIEGWVSFSRDTIAYDPNGRATEDIYQLVQNGTWVNNKRYLYTYQLVITGITQEAERPLKFDLSNNYPNPFNPSTKIVYTLSSASTVTLKIYDVVGKEVITLINGEEETGKHEIVVDGSTLPSGLYFYQLTAGKNFTAVKKMLLIK